MPIIKTNHILHEVKFTFDDAGNVSDVQLVVSYVLQDDVTNEIEATRGLSKSVWANLTAVQQAQLDALGRRFKVLAGTF